jgi:hypothetical protein
MPVETLFVRMDCSSTRHPQVARFTWQGQEWALAGVSLQRPGSTFGNSHPERPFGRGGPEQSGQFVLGESYRGCPSCGSDSFVRCGRCHELACWDRSWPRFDCPRCGNSGPVSGTIDSVRGSGQD